MNPALTKAAGGVWGVLTCQKLFHVWQKERHDKFTMTRLSGHFSLGLRQLKCCMGSLAVVALLSISSGAHAMGKMYLFSAVQGSVVQKGKPVSGARIEREFKWAWGKENATDVVTSDAEGKFSLPEIVRSSLLGALLPHEPMIEQTVLIKYQGQTFKAWMLDKGNYKANGEIGKPIVMECDLDAPLSHQGSVYGICSLK